MLDQEIGFVNMKSKKKEKEVKKLIKSKKRNKMKKKEIRNL